MDGLPALPSILQLESWFCSAVRETPVSNGLAIIIGCTSSFQHQEPLYGVKKDLTALLMTFRRLMFATLCLNNPTSSLIKEVIQHVSRLAIPGSWKRIVVTFSGHGKRNCLCANDDSVDLQKDIVNPLLPERARSLAHLSKLFFIDACRGPDFDPGIEITWQSPGGVVARGGQTRVSSRGGNLIACSTLKGMQSLEANTTGGFWMQLLASQLVDESNIEKTIYDILTRVNEHLEELCLKFDWVMQQPEFNTTLNRDVKLLYEALGNY